LTFQDAGGGVTPSGSNGNNCTPLSPTYNCTWNGIAIAGEAASGIGIFDVKGTSDVILRAPSFNIPNQGQGTTSVTFTGDYMLDGYIHIEGSVGAVGAFYPDAYVTVTLSVVGSPSNTNPQTYTDQLDHVELSQSDCSSTTVNGVGNCWRGIGFSSDKTFSYMQLLSPGWYYLSLTFETHAETTVSGAAGSTAMACFSPSPNSYCENGSWCSCTDVPPPSTQPASCPSGLTGNQCYYTQWKYTSYNEASPDFTVSDSPSTLFLYPGGQSGQEYITVQSVNGWSPAQNDSCTQKPANVVMWMGNGPEGGPQTVPAGFSFNWQNPNNVCNGLENIQVPSNGEASATLNLAVAGNTIPGTYTLNVTVEGPNNLQCCTSNFPYFYYVRIPQHFVLVTVVVFDPDFAISVNPGIVTVPSGTSGTYTITVAPINGFTGTVNLSYSASPAGAACTLNPNTITLGSQQTSALSCNSTTVQNYTLTVTGTSGSLSHNAGPLTFQVTAFTLSNNPSSSDWSILKGTWTEKNGVIDATYSSSTTDPIMMSTSTFASNRTVTVRAITITAGSNAYNTAWIGGKYVDSSNSIILILHTDGKVELQFRQNGVQSSYTTGTTALSPFVWHTFQMVFSGNTVNAYVDGTLYLTVTNSLVGSLGAAHIDLNSHVAPESQFDSATIS